ncbi:hypothetical protein SPRG_13623 [Saprolegnia parasitica CBS 223.65]|uniref:RNI-like protein n=1 Tax=Saprolegnia parasitica (strain CBS 223.65) TaxID=695850 RepID=A0A067C1Y5_SAPPC|nr:hypothetical protein SPRG_13623 [Saprolegnia parasitica CBS 223.65]KDO20807.1 hypothetical protein SPRG_13623 [Saprolegnia parasitica CBS 223.65]|eukprot:XP_012208466.1 hypothetical protein SPRG_13623 [Saprolegnia parasitica CBS 223.65]
MADRLSLELLELIASSVADQATMTALLNALPLSLLSPALVGVRRLLALHPASDVWPTLGATASMRDAPALAALHECISLYPVVRVYDLSLALPLCLTTRVELVQIGTPQALDAALDLWHGAISSLHVSVWDLRLGGRWSSLDTARLASALPHVPHLRELHLSWGGSTDGLDAVLDTIVATKITSLEITMGRDVMYWNPSRVDRLLAWLQTRPVRELHLTRVSLAPTLYGEVVRALNGCNSLHSLRLCDHVLGHSVLTSRAAWPAALQSLHAVVHLTGDAGRLAYASTLQRLSLIAHQYTSLGGAAVLEAAAELRYLRHFKLDCQVRDVMPLPPTAHLDLTALLPRLVDLSLIHTQLGDEGLLALASALPRCTRLQRLVLVQQGCTDVGAAALAAHLPLTLETLDLSSNVIGCDGASALASAIRAHLKVLRLGFNQMGLGGAIAFSEVMRQTEHMTWLGLQVNPIGADGVLAIVAALAQCDTRAGPVFLQGTLPAMHHPTDKCEKDACVLAVANLPEPTWCCLT